MRPFTVTSKENLSEYQRQQIVILGRGPYLHDADVVCTVDLRILGQLLT